MALLDNLAALRNKAAGAQFKTITVPRWEETTGLTVQVTYRLAEDPEITKLIKGTQRKEKGAARKASLQIHVDLATKVTISDGIETEEFDGFTAELGDALEVEIPSAQNVVERVFIGDGDMSAVGRAILEWSGYKDMAIDEDTAGE